MVPNLLIHEVIRKELDWHSDSIKSNQNEATMASAAAFTSDQKTYWLDWVVSRVRYRARPTRQALKPDGESDSVSLHLLHFSLLSSRLFGSHAPGVIWNATALLSLCLKSYSSITIASLWNAVVSSLAFVEFFKELFCHSSVRPFKYSLPLSTRHGPTDKKEPHQDIALLSLSRWSAF